MPCHLPDSLWLACADDVVASLPAVPHCAPASLVLPPPLLQVVNIQNGRVVASLGQGHDEDTSVEAVAFSRQLPHVAMSAGMDGKLILWDLASAAASTRATCEHPDVSADPAAAGSGCLLLAESKQ